MLLWKYLWLETENITKTKLENQPIILKFENKTIAFKFDYMYTRSSSTGRISTDKQNRQKQFFGFVDPLKYPDDHLSTTRPAGCWHAHPMYPWQASHVNNGLRRLLLHVSWESDARGGTQHPHWAGSYWIHTGSILISAHISLSPR